MTVHVTFVTLAVTARGKARPGKARASGRPGFQVDVGRGGGCQCQCREGAHRRKVAMSVPDSVSSSRY
eukprot:1313864-Rhodomonas_salina.1